VSDRRRRCGSRPCRRRPIYRLRGGRRRGRPVDLWSCWGRRQGAWTRVGCTWRRGRSRGPRQRSSARTGLPLRAQARRRARRGDGSVRSWDRTRGAGRGRSAGLSSGTGRCRVWARHRTRGQSLGPCARGSRHCIRAQSRPRVAGRGESRGPSTGNAGRCRTCPRRRRRERGWLAECRGAGQRCRLDWCRWRRGGWRRFQRSTVDTGHHSIR
jgi:hypothetical protein